MKQRLNSRNSIGVLSTNKKVVRLVVLIGLVFLCLLGFTQIDFGNVGERIPEETAIQTSAPLKKRKVVSDSEIIGSPASIDTQLYKMKITTMVNGDSSGLWPAEAPFPKAGAILPFKRIIAFYGNLYSKRMGILGELPPGKMLQKLGEEVTKWQLADSTIETIPALHYIAVTAQESPGNGGKYRLRMPFHQIDSVLQIARKIDAIVFLDIQIGLSTLKEEMKGLEKYLKMPNVHLGIDPEFSMKGGHAPGKAVGVYDAADINDATDYLAKLVNDNNLPPKILVVHRYTRGMVTNFKGIRKTPEVQLVIHMDGWGDVSKKILAYNRFIYQEPVQFTGFKIFYKNDAKSSGGRLLTPAELLQLKPQPLYIQYQ